VEALPAHLCLDRLPLIEGRGLAAQHNPTVRSSTPLEPPSQEGPEGHHPRRNQQSIALSGSAFVTTAKVILLLWHC
jgi:hypothetical protein